MADPSCRPSYLIGEQILTKSERMPDNWPRVGATVSMFLKGPSEVNMAE